MSRHTGPIGVHAKAIAGSLLLAVVGMHGLTLRLNMVLSGFYVPSILLVGLFVTSLVLLFLGYAASMNCHRQRSLLAIIILVVNGFAFYHAFDVGAEAIAASFYLPGSSTESEFRFQFSLVLSAWGICNAAIASGMAWRAARIWQWRTPADLAAIYREQSRHDNGQPA